MDVQSRKHDDRFELDIFQGYQRTAGYRLAYNARATPSFELLRFGRSGERCIATYKKAVKLENGYRHRILLIRDETGGMVVSVDGAAVIDVTDRSFHDPFNGVALANRGGDFSVREITVSGAK